MELIQFLKENKDLFELVEKYWQWIAAICVGLFFVLKKTCQLTKPTYWKVFNKLFFMGMIPHFLYSGNILCKTIRYLFCFPPILLNFDSRLIGFVNDSYGLRLVGFQFSGFNFSETKIYNFEGSIISNLTGEELPVDILVDGVRTPFSETSGIPPAARIEFSAPLNTSITDFKTKYMDITIRLSFDKEKFEYNFKPKRIQAELNSITAILNPNQTARVTRKEPQ